MATTEFDKTFGRLAKDKREQMKITQEKLSELVGISVVQCRNIEKGINRTNWVTWAKICLVLDIDITRFAEAYMKPEIDEVGKFLGIEI